MATAAAATGMAHGARTRTAAAALRSVCGTAARGRLRAGHARPLCTAPGTAPDQKRYLWERYREAKRSTEGECDRPPTRGAPAAVGTLPAGLGRQVSSHTVSREACSLGPVQHPLLIDGIPNRDPQPPRSPPTAGSITSSLLFRETRKNAPPETLQLLPFSHLESSFVNAWDV